MNRPFRLLLASLCPLLAAGCGGSGRPAASAEGGRTSPAVQTLRLTDSALRSGVTDTLRFGKMRSGEIAVKPLALRNDSRRPLVVAEIRRNCGCAELEFDRRPLIPGEERRAEMLFDTRGITGWQFKLVELRFAEEQQPLRLYIEAEVE